MGDREACDECKQKCSLIHGKRSDPLPRVTTFNKILYGDYDISKDLSLPRKISQAIPNLVAGNKYILQDTNRQQWEVTLGIKDNQLAFREGWDKFYEDHGLTMGYILAFHYTMNTHFVVEIFDKTGFEKIKFPVANGRKRKRSEIDGNCNAVGECQNLSNHLSKNQGAAFSGTSDSEARRHSQPMSKDKPLSLENGNSEYQLVASANCDIEHYMINRDDGSKYEEDRGTVLKPMSKDKPLSLENGNSEYQHVASANCDIEHYMINRDDGSKYKEDRGTILNLFNSEMQFGVDPHGSSDKGTHLFKATAESDAVAGIINENPVSAEVVRGESPAEVAASLSNNNNITSERENVAGVDNDHQERDQVHSEYRIKSSTAPQKRVRKVAARRIKHSKKKNPTKFNKRSDQIFGGDERDNEVRKVVKTELVDSFNDDSLDASAFSLTAIVRGHKLLELPTSVTLWEGIEKKVVNLQGPNKKVWPVLYHNKLGIKALTAGWENFFMSNRLQTGDECAFTLDNVVETIFRIDVNRK